MGLSRTVTEINSDFSLKNKKISHPVYFVPPLKGFPWELSIGAWSQKTSHGATGPRKKFDDIFSRLDTMHQRDGQTDGHLATAKTTLTHSVTR